VPPLSGVGITIAHAEWTLAAGAALLFSTNLMAIVGAGLVVFSAARLAARTSEPRPRSRRAFWTLTTFSIIVVSALIGGTIKAAQLYGGTRNVQAAAQQWVDSTSGEWALQSVVRNGDVITVTVLGTGDAESASSTSVDEDTARLLKSLRSEDIDVDVQFVSGSRATIN
jgi:uncharacterized membrane protein